MGRNEVQPDRWPSGSGWLFVALAAHIGWGAYPVFSRYLQTVAGLPSFSLLAAGSIAPAAVALVWLGRDHSGRRALGRPLLWGFALIVMARSITNLLAARFTLAIYVQLITLMTPLEVALLGRALFGESAPPGTYRAIALSLVGAFLMLSRPDLTLRFAARDWLGMGLALASSLFLALYMLVVRRAAVRDVPVQAVFAVHTFALLCFAAAFSIGIGERWSTWQSLSPFGWLLFLGFSGGVLLSANLGQVLAIGRLGASRVSSMIAIRLVAALAIAAVILGERLQTPLQGLGAVVVAGTITWFVSLQRTKGGTDG